MFKKIVSVLAVVFVFVLAGCSVNFGNDDKTKELENKVSELEKQLSEENTQAVVPATAPVGEPAVAPTVEPSEEPKNQVYTGASFIKVTSPKTEADFHEEPIVFKGNVSPDTTKIVVTAKMSYPVGDDPASEDIYRLQNFKYGDASFKYTAKVSYNNLVNGTNEYKFVAYFDDGATKSQTVTIYYSDSSVAEMGKPVIYLYPEKDAVISVNVKPRNGVSVSVPALNDGWKVLASPSGKLVNLADNKTYPYLFWEGYSADFVTPREGFVVEKKAVSAFFNEKLSYLGLNEKEIADFNEFWLPKLNEKPYYFVTFIPQTDFDKYAPLTVVPRPDTIIRVFFDYKGLDAKVKVPAQTLVKGERKGFTVIEWGGRLY